MNTGKKVIIIVSSVLVFFIILGVIAWQIFSPYISPIKASFQDMLSLRDDLKAQGFSDVSVQDSINYNNGVKTRRVKVSINLPADSFDNKEIKNQVFYNVSNYLSEKYQNIEKYDNFVVVLGKKTKILGVFPLQFTESRVFYLKNTPELVNETSE